MNQKNRICTTQGHNKQNISHICAAQDCSQQSRWICQECLRSMIHSNCSIDETIKINEVIIKLQQGIENNNIDSNKGMVFDEVLFQISNLEKQITDFKNKIQFMKISLTDGHKQQIQQIINELQSDQLYEFDQQKFEVILHNIRNNEKQRRIQLVKDLFNINDQVKKLEYHVNKIQKPQENAKKIDSEPRKYQEQLIDFSNQSYFGSSISQNERYLAYGGLNRLIKIYDLQQQRQLSEIKLEDDCYCCQFSNDSKLLYVAFGQGLIYCYNVLDKNKLIFGLEIHDRSICNIINIKDQFIITCSYDSTIIKTDVKSYAQIFKLYVNATPVVAISYMINNDIIVSGSQDKSIKFWNCNNQKIMFIKEDAHSSDIKQIQIINEQQNLLSLSQDGKLIKWQINLERKNILQIQEFNYPNRIYNFYQATDGQLLIISDKHVRIHDKEGQMVNQIKHAAGPNGYNLHCEQLDSLNYIQIRSQNKIMILKAQN